VKWGIPSEPAWAYLREKHPDLVAKGAEAFRITTAYDAGRKATVDALLAADVEGVAKMARVCTKTLGGPVQLLDADIDHATKRVTFTWERR
jgi:hypothetical protein